MPSLGREEPAGHVLLEYQNQAAEGSPTPVLVRKAAGLASVTLAHADHCLQLPQVHGAALSNQFGPDLSQHVVLPANRAPFGSCKTQGSASTTPPPAEIECCSCCQRQMPCSILCSSREIHGCHEARSYRPHAAQGCKCGTVCKAWCAVVNEARNWSEVTLTTRIERSFFRKKLTPVELSSLMWLQRRSSHVERLIMRVRSCFLK